MAYRIIDDNNLVTVANAIREKGGTSDVLTFPDGFVSAVEAISSGGSGFPSSAVFTESNLHGQSYIKEYNALHMAGTGTTVQTSLDGRNWYDLVTSISDINIISFVDGVWHGYQMDKGCYYSTDQGATWTLTNLPKANGYSISKPYNMWYCTIHESQTSAYYSLDGKTWTLIDGVRGVGSVIYADGVYINSPGGNVPLYRSTDGITWSAIDSLGSLSFYYLIWHKGRWFTYTNSTMYYSEDGGVTWIPITENPKQEMTTNGEVLIGFIKNDPTIYRSYDGLTWESCGVAFSSSYSIYISWSHGIWFTYTSSELYLSLDYGITWKKLNITNETYTKIRGIYFDGLTIFVHLANAAYSSFKWYYCPVFG